MQVFPLPELTRSQFILFIVTHNLSILLWYLGMLESKCLSEMGVSWVRFGTEEGWWVGLRCLGVVVGGVIVVHILLPWGYTWWDQTHAYVHGLRDASLQQLYRIKQAFQQPFTISVNKQ